jgi:hypothetical protein
MTVAAREHVLLVGMGRGDVTSWLLFHQASVTLFNRLCTVARQKLHTAAVYYQE